MSDALTQMRLPTEIHTVIRIERRNFVRQSSTTWWGLSDAASFLEGELRALALDAGTFTVLSVPVKSMIQWLNEHDQGPLGVRLVELYERRGGRVV